MVQSEPVISGLRREVISRAQLLLTFLPKMPLGPRLPPIGFSAPPILYEQDPSPLFLMSLLTIGYSYQAEVQSAVGDHRRAEALYRRALATATSLASQDPLDLDSRLSIAKLHHALGIVLSRNSQYDDAKREFMIAQQEGQELVMQRTQDAEVANLISQSERCFRQLAQCSASVVRGVGHNFELPTLIN